MSRPSVVLIEGTEAWILPSQGPLTAVPLSGDADTDANSLAALRDAILANGATRDLVLVIGGTWLQSARPALPPLPPSDRRRAVHHQSERFFAMRGAIASTVYDAVAVACEASWLRTLREQCASWATIRAVLALPEAVAASGNGAWHGDATPALRGAQPASIQIDVHAGVVADVRVHTGDDWVQIEALARGDASIEVWEASRNSDLFRKAYGRSVEIVESVAAPA